MSKDKVLLPILILSVALMSLLSRGCTAGVTETVSRQETTTQQDRVGTQKATPQTQEEGSPEPAQAEGSTNSEEVDHCVDCHTNKQSLIDTAEEVVEVEAESEGEG